MTIGNIALTAIDVFDVYQIMNGNLPGALLLVLARQFQTQQHLAHQASQCLERHQGGAQRNRQARAHMVEKVAGRDPRCRMSSKAFV